jgi:hypothetical protein
MKTCETRGHKYYPTVRRVTTWLGDTEENVLYCSRCGEVKNLNPIPFAKYTPYGSWRITTSSGTTSGWTYLGDLGTNIKV